MRTSGQVCPPTGCKTVLAHLGFAWSTTTGLRLSCNTDFLDVVVVVVVADYLGKQLTLAHHVAQSVAQPDNTVGLTCVVAANLHASITSAC